MLEREHHRRSPHFWEVILLGNSVTDPTDRAEKGQTNSSTWIFSILNKRNNIYIRNLKAY